MAVRALNLPAHLVATAGVYVLIIFIFSSSCIIETTDALNLSPIESLFLRSRLQTIGSAVSNKFRTEVGPSLLGVRDGADACKELDVTIIFPGAGGRDMLSDELEDALRRGCHSAGIENAAVATFDWKEHRGTVLTAAYDSETVGETVAKELWDKQSNSKGVAIRSVHCVGISVGAFAANGMATEICRLRGSTGGGGGTSSDGNAYPYVRLTLLDPFTSRGLTGLSYGSDNFGKCADYAVQYMNTDDPVPTTNEPLRHCVCYDVTSSSTRDEFVLPDGESLHCWPVAYYARHGIVEESKNVNGNFLRFGDDDALAKGDVVMVD